MTDEPDIVKRLREEEKLGKFENSSQGSHEGLEVPEELPEESFEDMPDETVDISEENFFTNHNNTKTPFQISEDKYRLIAENTSDLICTTTFSLKPTYTYVSPSYKKVLGYEPEEMIGKNCFDFIHPDDKKNIAPLLKKYFSMKVKKLLTGEGQDIVEKFVNRVRDKSGNWHYMENTANLVNNEMLFVSRDVTERMRIEGENLKFNKIIETTKQSVIIANTKGTVLYVNPSYYAFSGFVKDEVIGKSMYHFAHKKGALRLAKEVVPSLIKTGHWRGEMTVVKKDKQIVSVDLICSLFYNENKKRKFFVAIFSDITERKQAEEALQESEARIRALINAPADAMILIDSAGIVLAVNNTHAEWLKKSIGEIIGKCIFDFFPSDIVEYRKAQTNLVFNTGKPIHFEESQKERIFNTNVYPVFGSKGKVTAVAVYVRDITEHKKAEERTKRQNEINILRAEIWELAAQPLPENDLIQQLVDKIGPFFNFDSVNFMKIYPEEKAVVVEIQWQSGNKSGLGVNIPLWVLKRSVFGKPYFVASLKKLPLYARPIIAPFFKKYGVKSSLLVAFGDIDNPEGYIVASDTTDRDWSKEEINILTEVVKIISLRTEKEKAEEKLKESHELLKMVNRKLERKVEERTDEIKRLLKQKDEFIGQLGHDLKNPLGPLINLLPLLEKNETDPETKETFEILNRNVRHMKHLVVNTIELARLNSPNVKLNIEDTNLMDELNNVIKRNSLLFGEDNIEIENKADKDIIVKTDKLRLTELFDNLIGNSVKFSPDGGTVTIDTKLDKDFVTVSIKDAGIGTTEEQLSHIFDEFYKADESRHDFDSSGLGLPICKRIVEKHGGKIWAESEGEGKGTTMFFTLPMSSKKADDGKID